VINDQALDVATYSITLGAPSGGNPTIAKIIANTANGPVDVTQNIIVPPATAPTVPVTPPISLP
jgi:flagellar hook-associated protein 1 FlgK